ncbi:hypothetical protein JDV02_002437 [Purpureocillium takamizusanense]|uniref:Uncharacterized protein n=1 Tax=Purpureocillium takamizusanense TaxID=2060973 RepID=A0A9Q8QAA9_9HYPO|nr:uncharacterized protein JDV02_002437 [Purpureocillium takamizusanense]UNI15955.1 hypothetical protein JDV02_002437 [Purpureocillium takamizusanense]
MDATDCPAAAGGLPLANISPLPTFFIRFFPATGHQTTTQIPTGAPLSQTIRWTSCLALRDALYRAPAWTRVPAESRIPAKPFTIMKKIGMPTRYIATTRPAQLLTGQQPLIQDAKLELPSAKRRRLNQYTPSANEMEIHASPQSTAEIINAFMQAKVDLANHMLALDPEILLQDIEQLKKRATTSTPAKRHIDRNYHIEQHGLVGGYRLRGYDQVWHIVLHTIQSDTRHVNLKAAAIAEVSANLQELRRNPRKLIAYHGIPELSDIADVTEPESSLALMRPPEQPADAKSPTKREPQPSSPIKARRLSDTIVPLPPASSPRTEPSPTKSASPPSTPFVDTPVPRKIVATSPSLKATAATAAVTGSPRREESPTKGEKDTSPSVFAFPSPPDRPVAPTPSRWNRQDPSTPQTGLSERRESGLGLVDSIPPTPALPSALRGINAGEGEVFNFGCTSSSFTALPTSGSLAASGGSRRGGGSSKRGHRKSEPLLRSLQRSWTGGRPSLSPTKLSSDAASPGADTAGGSRRGGVHTPDMANTPDMSSSSVETPALSWGKLTGRPPAPIRETPKMSRGVFNVDARQNLDIFREVQRGGDAASAVDYLAKMAEEKCGGQAKVMIEQAMGKLFVRFKLPLEYASKFADTQRHDESRFTVTPSAISSSPRVRFPAPQMISQSAVSPATPFWHPASIHDASKQRMATVDPDFAGQDQTLAVAAFESPTDVPADTPPDVTSLNLHSANTTQLLQTPTMTGIAFASSPGAATQTPGLFPALQSPALHSNPDAPKSSDALASDSAVAETTQVTAAIQNTSTFTPLDSSGQRSAKTKASMPTAGQDQSQESQQTKRVEFDSPGRDYMRDFIMRAKPKRLSTTETGSPIAPPSKRQPLVAKSPNTESPQKAKRKADEDELAQDPTPLKKGAGRLSKRTRRHKEFESDADTDRLMDGTDTLAKLEVNDKTANRLAEGADGEQDAAEIEEAPVARRSSRLRSQKQPASAPKSSIPTAIKLGARSGAGRGAGVKRTQTDVSSQTRENTRKNKGNAEHPSEVLARQSSESDETEVAAADTSNKKKPSKKGTNVGWKEPLVAHKEEKTEKPKRGRTSKAKATIGNTGIAKPAASTKSSATATKQRSAKVAAKMGMSGNGTPARPARITRSSARNQQ